LSKRRFEIGIHCMGWSEPIRHIPEILGHSGRDNWGIQETQQLVNFLIRRGLKVFGHLRDSSV